MLSKHGVETYQGKRAHTTRQETLGHSRLSSLGHCGLILALKSGISVWMLISTLKKKSAGKMNLQKKLL